MGGRDTRDDQWSGQRVAMGGRDTRDDQWSGQRVAMGGRERERRGVGEYRKGRGERETA